MKTILKLITVTILTFGSLFSCASKNTSNMFSSKNHSKISSDISETKKSYTFVCNFSKDYLESIKKIVLEEYPEFNFKFLKLEESNSTTSIRLSKRSLKISYRSPQGEVTPDKIKTKNIANKIKNLKS